MSTLTITTFSPQVSWPHGGSTATLRIKYSDSFTDSLGQQVLRGFYQDVPCTIVGGVPVVPQFSLITTNDAQVNPLVTCSAQFIDSGGSARDWLFQQFSIPQSLTPTTNIAALAVYNQGSSLVLPPDSYLNRDEVVALINSMLALLGLGPATNLAQGIVLLSIAAADPAIPRVWGFNDPLVRDSLTWMGVNLDALMSAPANTNVPVYDAASQTWKPGVGTQGAAGGALSGTYPNPSVVDDSHLHSVATLVGLGALAILSTIATAQIDNDAVTFAKMQDVSAASRLMGRGDSGAGDPQEIVLGTNLSMSGTTLNASGGGGSTDVLEVQVFS